MSKYSGYVDRLEQNEKKRKTIIAVVVGVLVLTFLVGCIWGLQSVLNEEGTLDVADIPAVPASLSQEKDILGYVSESLDKASSDDVIAKLSAETYFEIDGEKINVGDSDEDNSLEKELAYAKDSILESIKAYDIYAKKECAFGEDMSQFTVPILFTENEADVSITVGETDEGTGEHKNIDKYYFKAVFGEYNLDSLPAEISKSFDFDTGSYNEIKSLLKSDFASTVEVIDSDIICKNFEMSGDINIESGRVNGICYSRLYDITLKVNFRGELADLGEKTISFPLCVYDIYSFTYAGIDIEVSELWLEKKGSEQIEVVKTHGDGEMTVSFTSSDESVAQVDEKGYVKGLKVSDKPVIITVTATYEGKTYIEECTVYVRNPVEGVELNRDVITLSVGSSETLVPVFEPKDGIFSKVPEFTGVKWYVGADADGNSYENAVTVDENGIVTVLSDNEAHYAEVYCVTDDGHFKATCEITIG